MLDTCESRNIVKTSKIECFAVSFVSIIFKLELPKKHNPPPKKTKTYCHLAVCSRLQGWVVHLRSFLQNSSPKMRWLWQVWYQLALAAMSHSASAWQKASWSQMLHLFSFGDQQNTQTHIKHTSNTHQTHIKHTSKHRTTPQTHNTTSNLKHQKTWNIQQFGWVNSWRQQLVNARIDAPESGIVAAVLALLSPPRCPNPAAPRRRDVLGDGRKAWVPPFWSQLNSTSNMKRTQGIGNRTLGPKKNFGLELRHTLKTGSDMKFREIQSLKYTARVLCYFLVGFSAEISKYIAFLQPAPLHRKQCAFAVASQVSLQVAKMTFGHCFIEASEWKTINWRLLVHRTFGLTCCTIHTILWISSKIDLIKNLSKAALHFLYIYSRYMLISYDIMMFSCCSLVFFVRLFANSSAASSRFSWASACRWCARCSTARKALTWQLQRGY